MDVVTGLFSNFGQERAVHPVYDRSVHFSGSAEHSRILVEIGDEDVLNLQVSPRMKKRNRVDETFQRSGAQMESLIRRRTGDEVFQL